jgi:hypothetical protein
MSAHGTTVTQAAARALHLEALPMEALVRKRGASFARVRAAGDWSDSDFRHTIGPVLLAFAQHVHLLPAHADDIPGSSLDHGLQACAEALVTAASGDASARHCPHAIVVHSLALPLGAALQRWQLCGEQAATFDPFVRTLAEHVTTGRDLEYTVMPSAVRATIVQGTRDHADRCLGAALLLRAAPAATLGRIASSDPALIGTCFHPAPVLTGMAAQLMASRAGTALQDIDAVRAAMERLIDQGRWVVNQKRARLWHLDEGLHLVWKTAAAELAAMLESEGAPGSTAADDLLQVLTAHHVVDLQAASGGCPVFTIRTPFTEALPVVRLRDPMHWLQRTCSVRQ